LFEGLRVEGKRQGGGTVGRRGYTEEEDVLMGSRREHEGRDHFEAFRKCIRASR